MVATWNLSHRGGKDRADYMEKGIQTFSPAFAQAVGVQPEQQLTRDEIAHLLGGRQASGKHIQGRRSYPNRVAYLDLTFSAPLSFSVAWGLAPTEHERKLLDQCFIKANQAFVDKALNMISHVRSNQADLGAVGAISFHHESARPTKNKSADMQRHAHNALLNTSVLPNGKIVTPNRNALKGNIKALGRYGHAHLHRELAKIGVKSVLDPKTGLCHLPDVKSEILAEFGNRSKEIGQGTPKQKQARALATRRGKDGKPTPKEWAHRLSKQGLEHRSVITSTPQTPDLVAIRKAEQGIAPVRATKTKRGKAPTFNTVLKVGALFELTKRTNAKYSETSHGCFGGIGTKVQVVEVSSKSITLQRADGKIGVVKLTSLFGKNGEVHLASPDPKPRRRKVMDREEARVEFEAWLRAHKIDLQGPAIIGGDKGHYVHVEGDAKGERKASYMLHLDDGPPRGWVKHFKHTELTDVWRPNKEYAPPTESQKLKWRQEQEQRNARRLEVQEKAGKRAYGIWVNAEKAETHAYLQGKGIRPHGARLGRNGDLVIPAVDHRGRIVNVQRISEQGDKRFVSDAKLSGTYGQIGTVANADYSGIIGIGEGFATVSTINEALKIPVRYAWTADNLVKVAELTRQQYPNAKIVIFADNDHTLSRREDLPVMIRQNKGIISARKAADAVNGVIVSPYFGAEEQGKLVKDRQYNSDWNDFFKANGMEKTKAELTNLLRSEGITLQSSRTEQRINTPAQKALTQDQQAQQRQASQSMAGHNRERQA